MGTELTGGVAVITGAGSGLGAGIAQAAARVGMTVIGADIAVEGLNAVVEKIRREGGNAHAHVTDVADDSSVTDLARMVHSKFGGVRLLVNNAAVEAIGRVWEIPDSVWRRTFAINLFGVANGLRAFVPDMIERGEPAWIANVGSIGVLGTLATHGAYLASKSAIVSVTESLRVELEPLRKPITVVAVLPGGVATRILDDAYVHPGEAISIEHTRQHIRTTMSPAQAGQIIFDGLTSGNFWISTEQAHMAGAAKARGAQLQNLAPPCPGLAMPAKAT